MSSQEPGHPGSNPEPPGPYTQEIQHPQVTARVPEKVSRGVLSTAVLVLQGPHEFVLDFVLGMAQPHQIAARVVLPPTVMPALIAALRENLHNFQARFGPPPRRRPGGRHRGRTEGAPRGRFVKSPFPPGLSPGWVSSVPPSRTDRKSVLPTIAACLEQQPVYRE